MTLIFLYPCRTVLDEFYLPDFVDPDNTALSNSVAASELEAHILAATNKTNKRMKVAESLARARRAPRRGYYYRGRGGGGRRGGGGDQFGRALRTGAVVGLSAVAGAALFAGAQQAGVFNGFGE